MRKTVLRLLTTMTILTGAMVVPVFGADATTLTVLHTNDIHGNVSDDGKSVIGFAKFATYVQEERKENDNLLVLDAGDMFQGLPYANISKGSSIIPLANAVGYDAMTVGNHEFDFGSENLFKNIVTNVNFPVIAANIYADNGTRVLEPYMIKEVDGVKVGIIGMTTEETAFKSHPDNTKGYYFADMIEETQKNVAELKEQGVDIIVVLAHLGLDEGEYTSDLIAEKVEGIDLIVDGHSHTVLEEGRKVGDTLIVSTGTAFNNVGRVEMTIEAGELESVKAGLLTYSDFADVVPNADVEALIEKTKAEQDVIFSEVVGQTSVTLDGTRGVVRTGETNLGQLATAAITELTGADAVLVNGGGIRASIEKGDITRGDLQTVFPFGNTIVVKELTGEQLLEALEYGTSEYPNEKGAFPHTNGVTFTLNAYKTSDRISDVKVNGEALDLNKAYKVATLDFISAGGDGYYMFKDAKTVAEYNTLMDTVIDHVQQLGTVEDTFAPRMTVVTEAPATEVAEEVVATEDKIVALRSYAQGKGYKVTFDNSKKQVTITKGDVEATLTIGERAYTVSGGKVGALTNALTLTNNVTTITTSDLEAVFAQIA